jgi:M6 family metalloprotease-like protein
MFLLLAVSTSTAAASPLTQHLLLPDVLASQIPVNGAPTVTSHAPTTGTVRVLVIPVEFTDLKHAGSASSLEDVYFGKVADYWKTASYSQLTVSGTVYPQWLTLKNSYAYYASTQDQEGFIQDAMQAANDVPMDGYNIIAFARAGHDSALTMNSSDASNVASLGTMSVSNSKGSYTVAIFSVSEDDPIGPIVHQMGHSFGIVDLWDHAVLQSKCPYCDDFVGEFDVMAHGFWANNGTTPAEPSAWTRIALGWLGGPQVHSVETFSQNETTLNIIEKGSGTLALKIPLSAQTYYLVEARKRVGYDTYLPDEGVIIYYVDETKGDGQGPVRLIPSNGTDINHAGQIAWKPGQFFSSTTNGVLLYVKSMANDSYTVVAAKGQPSDSPTPAEVTVKAPYDGLQVKVDDAQQNMRNGSLSLPMSWGPHELWVQPTVELGKGTRATFTGWSDDDTNNPRLILIMSDTTLTASFKTQFSLDVKSTVPVKGTGWYDANTTASLTAEAMVDYANGTRDQFVGWSGDIAETQPSVQLVMNTPKEVSAGWQRQYQLSVSSQYGNATGAGWYDAGSPATISVTTPYPTGGGVRSVFTGWNGDMSNGDAQTTVTMTKPFTVNAQWKSQYLVFIKLLDGDGVLVNSTDLAILFQTPSGTMNITPQVEGNWLDGGSYTVTSATFHGTNVLPTSLGKYVATANAKWNVPLSVFALQVNVHSILTGLPERGAQLSILFPDKTTVTALTDNTGVAMFPHLPLGSYVVLVSYQYMQWSGTVTLAQSTTMDMRMPVPLELVLIAASAATVTAFLKLWRRKTSKISASRAEPTSEAVTAPLYTLREATAEKQIRLDGSSL